MHDLTQVLAYVSRRFKGLPPVFISWVNLSEVDPSVFEAEHDWACCCVKDGQHFIGIHPRMRRAPVRVLRFLVFHELLHVALPPRGRCAHHKAFRVAERLWPDFELANKWLDDPGNW